MLAGEADAIAGQDPLEPTLRFQMIPHNGWQPSRLSVHPRLIRADGIEQHLISVTNCDWGPTAVGVGCAALNLHRAARSPNVKAWKFLGSYARYASSPALKNKIPEQMPTERAADFASYLTSTLSDLSAL